MGLMTGLMNIVFGGGRNVIAETAGIFREGAESGAARDAMMQMAALGQFGAEFAQPRKGWFDRLIDGLNRLPRPMMAFGTLGLVTAAMVDPIWFAARMQGLALVPEPLWWLMGAIVSFYFGARHQAKAQEYQSSVAQTMAAAQGVRDRIASIEALDRGAGFPEAPAPDAAPDPQAAFTTSREGDNAALNDWRAEAGR